MKSRPTVYQGTLMRSRLEARFAAFCDCLGWAWEYEPVAFADASGQYLPDFRVEGAWVEVKPTLDRARAARRAMEIIMSSEPHAQLRVAVPYEALAHLPAFQVRGGADWSGFFWAEAWCSPLGDEPGWLWWGTEDGHDGRWGEKHWHDWLPKT